MLVFFDLLSQEKHPRQARYIGSEVDSSSAPSLLDSADFLFSNLLQCKACVGPMFEALTELWNRCTTVKDTVDHTDMEFLWAAQNKFQDVLRLVSCLESKLGTTDSPDVHLSSLLLMGKPPLAAISSLPPHQCAKAVASGEQLGECWFYQQRARALAAENEALRARVEDLEARCIQLDATHARIAGLLA